MKSSDFVAPARPLALVALALRIGVFLFAALSLSRFAANFANAAAFAAALILASLFSRPMSRTQATITGLIVSSLPIGLLAAFSWNGGLAPSTFWGQIVIGFVVLAAIACPSLLAGSAMSAEAHRGMRVSRGFAFCYAAIDPLIVSTLIAQTLFNAGLVEIDWKRPWIFFLWLALTVAVTRLWYVFCPLPERPPKPT